MSKIVVEKEPNKRLFLIDGHLLCYYNLDSDNFRGSYAEIRDSGGVFKSDSNSILLRKKDFNNHSTNRIKEFLAYHMGTRLGNIVYDEIVHDFDLFRKLKEKVTFT